jgi:hypothetical protein
MALLTRRPRCVYEVYTEQEYLAGGDLEVDRVAADEEGGPRDARESRPGTGARRFAGAAALTGAVGVVGTLLGLALLRAQPVGRDTTLANVAGSRRPAVSRGVPRAVRAAGTHKTTRQASRAAVKGKTRWRAKVDKPVRVLPRRSHASAPPGIHVAWPRGEYVAPAKPAVISNPAAPTSSPAGNDRPASTDGSAHSEFGFER